MRLKELDFLRGIAIILVLFRHHYILNKLYQIGWIGVDLFFVLSGFLVSGLLFREYKKSNHINVRLFLIRRGFKIYPLFYVFILLTAFIEHFVYGYLNMRDFFSEAFFVQNYLGNIWWHTWSLAVEEHFYFGLAFFILFLVHKKLLGNVKLFFIVYISIFILCLYLRIYNNLHFRYENKTHLFQTHLRIDSLFFGVLLSYLYHFRKAAFVSFFTENRTMLYIGAFVLLIPVFFIKSETVIMNTIGLCFLFVAFGIILSNFICDPLINKRLRKIFSPYLVSFITNVGLYSYAIYLFHMPVEKYGLDFLHKSGFKFRNSIEFGIYFFTSIFVGIIASKIIEQPLLKIRDRYFPGNKQKKAMAQLVSPP